MVDSTNTAKAKVVVGGSVVGESGIFEYTGMNKIFDNLLNVTGYPGLGIQR